MREHNYSSISNTSIHEAYPGHHLQLSVAGKHPSLTRALTDAPEFVEGWGMYSEQMMREQGFDDAPELPAEHAHRRDLAGLPDHPRRADPPGRDRGRRGHPVHGRADALRGGERAGGGPPLHLHPDLPAELPPGQGPAPPAPGGRAAAARQRLLAEGLPRHAPAQRQPPDQLPSATARRRGRSAARGSSATDRAAAR